MDHFGELESIAMDTLNLTNYSQIRIQVKQNLCGSVPSTIEITDLKRGNIFLNFGDFKCLNPPVPTVGTIMVNDFRNSIDFLRIREALQNEGSDLPFFPSVLNLPKSTFAHLHIARNPFAILEHLQEPSSAPEKTKEARSWAETALIALEFKKSSLLDSVKPIKNGCLVGFVGYTKLDSPFKKQRPNDLPLKEPQSDAAFQSSPETSNLNRLSQSKGKNKSTPRNFV